MTAKTAAFFTGVAGVTSLWALSERDWPWAALFAISAAVCALNAWALPAARAPDDRGER